MIVVGFLGSGRDSGVSALEIARAAAATGARVEMVGAAASDASGDARLLELAAAGVGHATVIRSRADRLEPADLDLALRYLPDVHAIVLVRPEAGLVPVAAAAAAWTGATLVVVGASDAEPAAPDGPGDSAIVLDPPAADHDATFAGFVAALAVRLDAGAPAAEAWRATVQALAADPV